MLSLWCRSDFMNLILLLASLETNFIGEVKQWGKNELDMEGQHWTFIPLKEIEKKDKLEEDLYKKYKVTDNRF